MTRCFLRMTKNLFYNYEKKLSIIRSLFCNFENQFYNYELKLSDSYENKSIIKSFINAKKEESYRLKDGMITDSHKNKKIVFINRNLNKRRK